MGNHYPSYSKDEITSGVLALYPLLILKTPAFPKERENNDACLMDPTLYLRSFGNNISQIYELPSNFYRIFIQSSDGFEMHRIYEQLHDPTEILHMLFFIAIKLKFIQQVID